MMKTTIKTPQKAVKSDWNILSLEVLMGHVADFQILRALRKLRLERPCKEARCLPPLSPSPAASPKLFHSQNPLVSRGAGAAHFIKESGERILAQTLFNMCFFSLSY